MTVPPAVGLGKAGLFPAERDPTESIDTSVSATYGDYFGGSMDLC
jgi:hypothetical protein